jgi:hypothetical protein
VTFDLVVSLTTFLWLGFWSVKAARSILNRNQHSVDFLVLAHFVFFGIPEILDALVSRPTYFVYPAYRVLQYDRTVDLLYSLYISICPVVWWRFGRSNRSASSFGPAVSARRTMKTLAQPFRVSLCMLSLLPCLMLLAAPDPGFYSQYAAIIRSSVSDQIAQFHGWITVGTDVSVLSVAVLCATSPNMLRSLSLWLPVIGVSIWLNGKRNIVALTIVLLLLAAWERRSMSKWQFATVALVSAAGFAFYSYSFQTGTRQTNLLEAAAQYENFRIDYGRDHVVKYALYCELHPAGDQILDYRGESIIFDLAMYVPRQIWPDKPWPYAVYSTAAGLGGPVRELGWGITTSWLEEAIANFGWVGLIAGPALFVLIARVGDASANKLCGLLTILNLCLLLVVQISAFHPLCAIWLIVVLAQRSRGHSVNTKRPKVSHSGMEIQTCAQ